MPMTLKPIFYLWQYVLQDRMQTTVFWLCSCGCQRIFKPDADNLWYRFLL